MKKRNAWKTVLAVAGTVFSLFLSISCKSAPAPVDVDLLALVDADAPVYFFVPVENYQDFVQSVLQKKVNGLSQKDAAKITERMTDIYVAAGLRNSSLQIASSLSIPQFALKSALSEKNGWVKESSQNTSIPYTYYHSTNGVELSFPTETTALVSYNAEKQLGYFDKALTSQINLLPEETDASNKTESSIPEGFNPVVYNYLTEPQRREMRFIAPKPSVFIRMLIGKQMNLALRSVYGSITKTPSGKEAALSIVLKIEDPRAIKAAAQVVKLAIFPVAAKISVKDSTHIVITDYTISWNELNAIISK